MSATAPALFGTQIIGQTEKALNAILERQLDGTGITEPQWVTLTLTILSEGSLTEEALAERVADSLKIDDAAARERIAELAAAHLVQSTPQGTVEATGHGAALWREIRASITQITQRLWGDVPQQDLATAGSVLTTILARANALLAA
ncbi:hypothetical protein [Streptomyces sp. 6N223]|uniref:hypothetical protein n=1 Tax=Streptomyces sp. 6N223 TaxID=3457412 RepID=UPI003FD0653E